MKLMKRIAWVLAVLIIISIVSYLWQALPIISGYGAKMLCSCTFLAGRTPQDVNRNELGSGFLAIGSFEVDVQDSSATGKVFGLARKKAIFRKGLGCTLINEITEQELRSQKFHLSARTPVPDSIPWPTGNLITASGAVHDKQKLTALLDDAFSEPGTDSLRRTRAILIIYKGELIAERYAEGFDSSSLFLGWSMTKSLTNAMIGVLVKKGKLQVKDAAPISSWAHDLRKRITIEHLLHASSGLRWEENYGGPSDATNMLFKSADMGSFAAAATYESEPETVFEYSSGTTNILQMIIRQTAGEAYHSFAYDELFNKIGMMSLVLEPDASGTFVGSSYSFATARDWSRFGLLYLYDGTWEGEQLLPEDWVEYSTRPAPAATRGEYGAQFWLNHGAPDDPGSRFFPDVPADLFYADGYEGQNVFILPSKDLVVVKLSLSQGDYLDDNTFLAGIVEATAGR